MLMKAKCPLHIWHCVMCCRRRYTHKWANRGW